MDREFLKGLVEDEAAVDAILQEHGRVVEEMGFHHALEQAVNAAGGRNLTAIRALMDENAILGSEDRERALAEAVKRVKKDSPYLFQSPAVQPYAGGTPAQVLDFSMEDIGAMSMAEYRRFRRGG